MAKEMQSVTKIYDVLKWLIPHISKLPRSYRFTLGDRVTNICLDILMLLIEASYAKEKLDLLQQANMKLEQLRYILRLCKDFGLFQIDRYEYVSREINEAGKLIGGWIKQQKA